MAARAGLAKRFWQYLLERFPPLGHALLVVVFTFSAIAYSIVSRGGAHFISGGYFALAAFITVMLFLLLRISDEFKDAEEDARYRPDLPVPRGLISLAELRSIAIVIIVAQISLLLAFAPRILPLYALALGYMALMFFEFGVPHWLKNHQWAYNASHMVIIPLVDIVASGFDWRIAAIAPPLGLAYFFAVSYCNGIVLELGRKMGVEGQDDPARRLYTTRLGQTQALLLYSLALLITFGLAWMAANYAAHRPATFIALVALLVIALLPALLHATRLQSRKTAKAMEVSSGIWTLGMYLFLGGLPLAGKLIGL